MEDVSKSVSGVEDNFHSVNPNELNQEIENDLDVDVGDI